LQKLISYFFSDYQLKPQSNWFKKYLYSLLIIKAIYWLVYYEYLFGTQSVIPVRPAFINPVTDLAFLLFNHPSQNLAYYFIVLVLAVLFLFAVNVLPPVVSFIMNGVIFLVVINLQNKIYSTLTGGSYLLNQFLLFNCFLSPNYSVQQNWRSSLKVVMHNFAGLVILIQVCLVYLLSAIAKCTNAQWLNGTALYALSNVHHYFLYVSPNKLSFNWFFVFLNYLVIIYQLSFPILIFFKRIKKPVILIGLTMHLYIAFVMGLVEFSLVMILAYIYFWPFKKQIP
jgi:hypothetical protein